MHVIVVAQVVNSVPAQGLIGQTVIPGVKFEGGKVGWEVDTVTFTASQRPSYKVAWLIHVNPKPIKWKLRMEVHYHLVPPGVRSR